MTELYHFCREASLARDEPLLATASRVRRWILVERNGPWGADALRDNRLGSDASARLRALGVELGARVLLIKRHGRYAQRGLRVMVSFTGGSRRWLEALSFDHAEALLAHDYSPLRRGRSVGGEAVTAPRFFVCTHGTHDPCCARHGRRIVRALEAEMPEATWETSHIGGDRFAGNILILPLGIYYGRVAPDDAVALMRRLVEGELDLACYRGRTSLPFSAQAAEALARERLSLRRVDDLALTRHEQIGPRRFRSTFGGKNHGQVVVEIEVDAWPEACLTCHADRPVAAPRYRLLRLEGGGASSDQAAPR